MGRHDSLEKNMILGKTEAKRDGDDKDVSKMTLNFTLYKINSQCINISVILV